MALSGGTRANRTGNRLEDNAASILDDLDYRFVNKLRFFPMRVMQQPIYSRQVEAGKDIYGKQRRVDLLLYHPRLWANCLAIQCKWQAVSGSVEQKYPFEVLSIQQDEFDTFILLDGGGYSLGARQWLLNQAGKNRLKQVLSLGDFQRMASQGKLG